MKRVVIVFTRGCIVGGIRNFGLSLARNIEDTQVDFLVFTKDKSFELPELNELGGKVYTIDSKPDVYTVSEKLRNIMAVFHFFKEHKYDAIHCNITSKYSDDAFYLLAAKLYGVNTRIVHSHHAEKDTGKKSLKLRLYEGVVGTVYKMSVTDRIGCSKLAYDCVFDDDLKKVKKHVIYNGINVDKFYYPVKEINGNSNIKLCSVGRFSKEKNFVFLIRVFNALLKRREDLQLNIVGYGEQEDEIKAEIDKFGIEDRVKLYPGNTDVAAFLKEQDVYIMPSLYEGYPITLAEAQTAGLHCFVAANVTKEADVGLCEFIEGYDEETWAQIIDTRLKHMEAVDLKKEIYEKFDEKKMAERFRKVYYGEE